MGPEKRIAFVERVCATLREHDMIRAGERVLAAVSGGADSVCLMHVLHSLGFSIEVAHFDHQTRKSESTADAAFVCETAVRLFLPFHLESRDVPKEARAAKRSFEEYARERRYDFLVRTAKAQGCAVIATGHHADDQAETILMRILRGTSPRGLAGIPPVRVEDGVRIIRPLIECTREEIAAYLREHEVPYRTDRSNVDPGHFRNRVRHELLPLLSREYNANVRDALLRLAEAQRDDADYLAAAAASAFEACTTQEGALDRHVFAHLHIAVQRRVLLMLAWRHGVDGGFDLVDAGARFVAKGPAGNCFDLGGGVLLRNARTITEIVTSNAVAPDTAEIVLEAPGLTHAFGRVFTVRYHDHVPDEALDRYCCRTSVRACRQVFDADALGGTLTVRHRRPGDRFTPLGMTGARKLQDYFVDLGLSIAERDAQVILLAEGRIAWIVGRAISAHGAVTPRTRRVLEIEVSDDVVSC